jgi:putative membrane protein
MMQNDEMILNDTAGRELNPGFKPYLQKNDRTARLLIWIVSIIVFVAIAVLSKVKVNADLGFDPHNFAKANAVINFSVTVLLLAGLWAVRSKKYLLHKRIMIAAIILSVLFLVSYICHHLFAGETKFGDTDHNGIVSADEKSIAGSLRVVYYFILGTHIPLAGIILPFILFTSYRSLTGDYTKHKKLARFTFPIWLYVAITGVLVYLLISPYYY